MNKMENFEVNIDAIGRKILVEKVYSMEENHVEEYISTFMEGNYIESIEEIVVDYKCYLITFKPFKTYLRFLQSLFCGRYLHEIPGVKSLVKITLFTGIVNSPHLEMFIQCEISRMTDDELVSVLSSYFREYTYRKSPNGFIVKYSKSKIIKNFPFHEVNIFPSPTDNIPINQSHEVNAVYFIHTLNLDSNLSPFHMRFSSAHVIETTVMNKTQSIKTNTNSRVHVRTYVFHYSERELRRHVKNYHIDKIEMYCYHYYSVIRRMLGHDEHEHFVRNGCQVHNVLVVENEDWNCLIKAVQTIKKFSSKPYLKPEYRTFNTPLVFYLFQEYEDDKIKVIKHGQNYSSYIMAPRNEPEKVECKKIDFKCSSSFRKQRWLYQIFYGDFSRNKQLINEITEEIKILRNHSKKFQNRIVDSGGERTEWLCKLEIGKLMFWSKRFSRHAASSEVSLKDLNQPQQYRMRLTQFYRCDLNIALHDYVRSLEGKKLRKTGEKKDFPVTCVDCSDGKEFTLNFMMGTDGVLEFDRYIEQTLFTRIYVAHSYSFELDYEITFYKNNESLEVEGGVKWIVGLFQGKNIREIDELILLTNDRYIFYYDTNLENTTIEKYTHEKSGFEVEIKEEKKMEVVGEEEETFEHTTYIIPPKFIMQEGDISKILRNVSRFASELLKKGTILEAKRKSRKKGVTPM